MSVTGTTRCVTGRRSTGSRLAVSLLGAVLLAGCVSPGSPSSTTSAPSTSTAPTVESRTATTDIPDGTTTDTLGSNATLTHGSNVTIGEGDQPAALESRLYGLVTAENRTAYAAARGLDLRNGSVLVVVELRPGRELPASFDVTVRSRYENLVQAFVPVGDLVPIAEHGNVSFVRTPHEPVTDAPSLSTSPTSAPPDTPPTSRHPWHRTAPVD